MARRPQLVALGAALQFSIMPAMGFAVSRLLQLPLPFSVGCARMRPITPSLQRCLSRCMLNASLYTLGTMLPSASIC